MYVTWICIQQIMIILITENLNTQNWSSMLVNNGAASRFGISHLSHLYLCYQHALCSTLPFCIAWYGTILLKVLLGILQVILCNWSFEYILLLHLLNVKLKYMLLDRYMKIGIGSLENWFKLQHAGNLW